MLIQSVADRVLFIPPIGIRAQQSVLESNPLASVPWVAQWKFNNNGNDSIGANNLTAVNSPTFTTGLLGGATGATQLVRTSSQSWSVSPSFNFANADFSVLGWVNPTTLGNYRTILSKYTSVIATSEIYLFIYGNGAVEFDVYGAAADWVVTPAGAIAAGSWQMVAAWWDSATKTAYLQINNGTIYSKVTAITINSTGTALVFGSDVLPTVAFYYNGLYDNFCIAKSAAGQGGVLTAAQRSAFFAAGVGTELVT